MGLTMRPGLGRATEERTRGCPFCSIVAETHNGIVVENNDFVAIFDKFPVNPGHTLLLPRRHVTTVFELLPEEWLSLHHLLAAARDTLDAKYRPDGFNIGINCGATAGQTIPHLHVHLIPRFKGDVPNPQGGIRNFKPPSVPYP